MSRAVVLAFLVVAPLSLRAAAPPAPIAPAGDLNVRAQAILRKACHRCHGEDGSVEGGMNYVLDFKTLVVRKKIVPGDAATSKLYKRLTSADNPMPPR